MHGGHSGQADVAALLRTCISTLETVMADLDPAAVPLPHVTGLWKLFSRAQKLSAAGELSLADQVRRADEWRRSGYQSAEEWMARQKGTSVGDARGRLEASKHLEALPDTAAALRAGLVSPEQAVIVADAAIANPAAEADLLRQAGRDSHSGLRREAARRKAQALPDGEERARRHHRERKANVWTDAEGRCNLAAQGPLSASAGFVAWLERETDRRFREAQRAGAREPREAYMFDALMSLSASGPGPESGNDRRRVAPKHLALIRVDLTALRRGSVAGDELCEIGGLGPVSVSEARALLGDSILHLVITKGQAVQSITHLGRGPNAVQQLALLWQSETCSVLGCARTRVEHDHRIEFNETRHTRLDELDPLCTFHHRQKTHRGWALVAGSGDRDFVPPDDARHPARIADGRRSAVPPRAPAPTPAAPGVSPELAARLCRVRAKIEERTRDHPDVAEFLSRVNAYLD